MQDVVEFVQTILINFIGDQNDTELRKTSISDNVMILGTKYNIIKKRYDEDETFKKRGIDGWCSSCKKEIVYCVASTHPAFENENDIIELELYEKEIVRHEIVHAFFSECGLRDSAFIINIAWCKKTKSLLIG